MDKRRNHIIFWVGYFFLNGGLAIAQRIDFSSLPSIITSTLLSSILTLFLFYFFVMLLFPKTLPNENYFLLIVGIFFSFIFVSSFHYLVCVSINKIYPTIFPSYSVNNSPNISFHNSSMRGLFSFIKSLNLAFPYWLIKIHFAEINKKRMIERKFYVLEKSVLSSQLLSLKNQINPHFFYNILNFLYAQALPFSHKLSSSILTLSDMMRYAIRENEDEGKVSLEQEVNYLKHYIQLENLNSNGVNKAILEINGNFRFRRIFPMTFQPFLENSFKWGRNNKFYLEVKENQINFTSTYYKKDGKDMNDIYEDFENVKKRMLNEYVNNCSIKIIPERHFYELQLLLKI